MELLEGRSFLDAVPIGPEVRVNTYTTAAQELPAIAADADGDFVIAWQSTGQDGSGTGIFAQRFDASGAASGGELRVSSFSTGDQAEVSVAADASGGFIVTWMSAGQDGFLNGVFAQRYAADGSPIGDEFRVNETTSGDEGEPRVAIDGAGNFVIVWEATAASGFDVRGQRYDLDGTPQGNEFTVNTTTAGTQGAPAVAMSAAGQFTVAWQSEGQDGSGYGIYAQRFNSQGVPQGDEFRVNAHTPADQLEPTIGCAAEGGFVICWESFEQQPASGYDIYARRYDAAGAAQSDEFLVNEVTADWQRRPAISMDADGDFVVTWQSHAQDGSGYGVYARRYGADGSPRHDEIRINTVTHSNQLNPVVAAEQNGDFISVWQSAAQDGDQEGIIARRFGIVPLVTASSFRFTSAPHQIAFTFSQGVSSSLGVDDLRLANLTTMQDIPASDLVLSYNSTSNTAVFTYSGTGTLTGVFEDGDYRATLFATGILNSEGRPLPADVNFDFFFLNADANHDRRVNLLDFSILAASFGRVPSDFTDGDFNFDGLVNLADFNILAGRFGTALGEGDDNTYDSLLA